MKSVTAGRAARKPRSKPARTALVLARPGDEAEGRLLITEGQVTDLYYVGELPTEIPGRAFKMTKFGAGAGDGYDVLIGARPADSTCCCKGHTYHGHCRHVEALTALLSRGLLTEGGAA